MVDGEMDLDEFLDSEWRCWAFTINATKREGRINGNVFEMLRYIAPLWCDYMIYQIERVNNEHIQGFLIANSSGSYINKWISKFPGIEMNPIKTTIRRNIRYCSKPGGSGHWEYRAKDFPLEEILEREMERVEELMWINSIIDKEIETHGDIVLSEDAPIV